MSVKMDFFLPGLSGPSGLCTLSMDRISDSRP